MSINFLPIPSSFGQLIIEAIDALNEKMGSNKTSISKYIESKYPNLPAGHSTLLKHHLNRMKETEELIFWKNNYMKPDPNFIRRGRGRPPKPKEPGMQTSSSPARPRGRPRKDEYDAGDVPIQVPAATTDPVKKQKVSPSEDFGGSFDSIGMGSNSKTGRPRGRPPKVKPQLGGEGVSA
ncbi:HMG-Y-related protein B-like isoform X2 [Amaranthus tricolor]|uniref:HMG-Y-related protein B-like isoform X2 n=1 Tax=Amaranthus tricolor TaxID=29722 RepID=UPI0025892AC2|nr:HMG-Y-related protein B-like isoform X2 [Amaranthus tricolor]